MSQQRTTTSYHNMPMSTISLLDGTSIPWLGWGNGTGNAQKNPVECGKAALANGINHIDTAQIYATEPQTGEAIRSTGVKREDVYITSKLWGTPIPLASVRESVQKSLDALGFIPDLYLVHNPFVAGPGELQALWRIFEELKDEGKLKSIGVSNFRVQDLEEVLKIAKYMPVVNQIEYHPYTLAHLEPVLALQAKHGIVTESYGTLTPTIRHPTGGPLKPVLERIAARINAAGSYSVELDPSAILLLWARAKGVVVVTASGSVERIAWLGKIAALPAGLLTDAEVEEIDRVGKSVHFRHYREHMEKDFPLPNLPSQ